MVRVQAILDAWIDKDNHQPLLGCVVCPSLHLSKGVGLAVAPERFEKWVGGGHQRMGARSNEFGTYPMAWSREGSRNGAGGGRDFFKSGGCMALAAPWIRRACSLSLL